MHYYHFIANRQDRNPDDTFTSAQVAESAGMDGSLVRKDLAAINIRGCSGRGFRTDESLEAIRYILGFDEILRAVIIGAGRLGGALASYHSFTDYGVEICGLFDIAPHKTGLTIGAFEVRHVSSLPNIVRQMSASIAILTVPPEAAQESADNAVAAGIRGIWNFAGTRLELPKDVCVRHEHISVGLAELGYKLRNAT